MSEYKVRRALEKDIPAIMELLVQVDMVHHNGRPDIFNGPATKYNEEQLAEILADPKRPVFVCVNGEDTAVGHAFCVHKQIVGDPVLTDIRSLYIDDICVDENCRGHHVGKLLYDHVLEYAKSEDFYNVTLNVWSCNPSALAFYEAMGMKPQKIGMEKLLKD
ncbi:MAG: GNAT family N-acetyltransferase [Butyrivibrio sp.]|nr:GNAT family N-acetyltransferase [Butyrivibrio sp.]